MKRLILALIFSPLFASLIFIFVEPIAAGRAPNLKLIFSMLPLFYIFTLIGVLVIGLPIYFLFKKLNILNLMSLVLAGGLTGIAYVILITGALTSSVSSIDLSAAFPSFLMGAITALVFGLLAGIPLTTTSTKEVNY